MIIFPGSLILAAPVSLKNTRIGYQTWLRDLTAAAITVSSETAAGPRDAPLRPDTYEFWEPESLPAWWLADLGAVRDVDYVGILGSIGSNGAALELRHSLDTEFSDYVSIRGADGNYVSTPDSAANSITGDLELELELAIVNADLPDFFLDFLGDWDASVAKITGGSPAVGSITGGANGTVVNASGLIEAASAPRKDHDPITRAVLGLLVEEARTNLALSCDDMRSAAAGNPVTAWTNTDITVTVAGTTAPDGSGNGNLITEGTAGTAELVQVIAVTANVNYAVAKFMKRGNHDWVRLTVLGSGGNRFDAWFNLATGAVGTTSAGGTGILVGAYVKAFRDGWYGLFVTGSVGSGLTSVNFYSYSASGNGVSARVNNATRYEYRAVFNNNVSFATSPTTATAGSSVTRSADVATITDISDWFNASEGTRILRVKFGKTVSDARALVFNNGGGNERMLFRASSILLRDLYIASGSTVADINGGSAAVDQTTVFASGYKVNDFAFSANGVAVAVDTAGAVPTVSQCHIGRDPSGAAGTELNGHFQTFDYYATRRTNAAIENFSRQTYRVLASKWAETGNQRAWALCLTEHCSLVLFVSTAGTAATIREFHSAPLDVTEGARFRVRVRLDLTDGTDSTCTFETSEDDGETWDALSTVTQAPVAGIFDSTAPLEYGAFNGGTSELEARLFQLILRQSLDGATAAHFNTADAASEAATTITSSTTGEVWTIHSSGVPAPEIVLHAFSAPLAPADDAPIMALNTLTPVRYLRVGLTGSGAPRISNIYAGVALAMERPIRGGGFVPLQMARSTQLRSTRSRGGQILGQDFRRHGIEAQVNFQLLDSAWVRSHLDPFIKSARQYPYFLAWRPLTHPLEVAFGVTEKDIRPSMQGLGEMMQVGWEISGVGNE
jgi:hypothetical protein